MTDAAPLGGRDRLARGGTAPGGAASSGLRRTCWRWLPDRLERRRLFRMWYRHRRQPWRSRVLPAVWRRQARLAFWWTWLRLCQDDPVWVGCGLLCLPAWLLLVWYRG
jgi:hypothetical protein